MSPYKKYLKSPFKYSDLYYQWKEAIIANNTAHARVLAEKHKAKFGMR